MMADFRRLLMQLNDKYPELVTAFRRQQTTSFAVDGEIVTFEGGVTGFARLQARMQVRHPSEVGPANARNAGASDFFPQGVGCLSQNLMENAALCSPVRMFNCCPAIRSKPKLVAQIGFTEWTAEGKLRHPRFLGLRSDKKPEKVMREQ
jgi:ATP-dependent DNA ligase